MHQITVGAFTLLHSEFPILYSYCVNLHFWNCQNSEDMRELYELEMKHGATYLSYRTKEDLLTSILHERGRNKTSSPHHHLATLYLSTYCVHFPSFPLGGGNTDGFYHRKLSGKHHSSAALKSSRHLSQAVVHLYSLRGTMDIKF